MIGAVQCGQNSENKIIYLISHRGAALDSVMDVSSALGERLDAMHAALAAEAARLRLDEPVRDN